MSRAGLGEWGGYITSLEVVGTNATVTVSTPRFNLKSTWWKPRDQGNPYGGYDALQAVSGNQVRVTGWAVDPDSTASIQVHAYVDGQGQGSFTASVPRPDIAAALGRGERHGFDFVLPVSQGGHEVCVYAINVGPGTVNPLLGCRTVDTGGLPIGIIETATIDGADAVLTGWTVDPDTAASLSVHAYVNGVGKGAFSANLPRADVAARYPDLGPAHGFDVRVPLQSGVNEVCLYAINVPAPAMNPKLGCRTLELKVDPFGNFEAASGGAADITISGWALDPETSAPINVHVYVDGVGVGSVTADRSRPDVAAAYPAAGNLHGFSATLSASPGSHEVCVFAMNALQGTVNPKLGCRTVNVGLRPIGRIESASVDDFEVRVRGWALDPDTSASINVHLYVDGRPARSVTASGARPDVAAIYPSTGPAHGFDARLSVPAGRHTVCAYGINVLGATGNPLLSCMQVVVAQGQSLPFGMLDSARTVNGITTVGGWAVEPDAPTAPVTVYFSIDGRLSGRLVARTPRADVAAAFAGVGPDHGYSGHFILSAGRHSVCAYAVNQGPGSGDRGLGCRVVTVP